MAAVTICSDFGAQENKLCHCFPIYLPWSDGTGCHDLHFWMLSFKPTFHSPLSPSSRVSLVPLCFQILGWYHSDLNSTLWSFSLAFCMMYSSYKLNKQGDDIYPWCTPLYSGFSRMILCAMKRWPSLLVTRELSSEGLGEGKRWKWREMGIWRTIWEEVSRMMSVCISVADSCWCMSETNTKL